MPCFDRSGSHILKVGDPVKIPGKVKTITDDNTIVVESDELDYPSTTDKKDLTVSPRIVKLG